MLNPEFLRRQAENCLRIARSCFDLASAERLRLMAAELNAKAAEMDETERQNRWPHAMERNRFLEQRSRIPHTRLPASSAPPNVPCTHRTHARRDDAPESH